MVVALEQSDLAKRLSQDETDEDIVTGTWTGDRMLGPLILGVFYGDTHYNLGEYDGEESRIEVKKILFDIIRTQLNLTGVPKLIGNFEHAKEYLETALASIDKK